MKRALLVGGLLLSTGACASGKPASGECDAGQLEIDGSCVTLCVEDVECPSGFYCFDGKCTVGNREAAAIVSMTPVPGSIDVGVMPLITLTFSVPMDLVSLTQTVHLLVNGETRVGGNISLDETLTILTFNLGNNLTFGSQYTMRVEAGARSTGDARVLARWEGVFTTTATPDVSLPEVATDEVVGTVAAPELDALSSFTFTGTASDADTSIEQVQVQVVEAGSSPGATWISATVDGTGNSATWSYRWFPKMLEPLPNGTYTLHARAYDKGGNLKVATPMSFVADLQPPAPPTFVSEPKTPWKFRNQILNVQAEPDATIEIRLNDVVVAGSPFGVGSDGVEGISITLPSLGTFTVALFAIDANGNRNDTPVTRTIQRIAYSCLTPAHGYPVMGATVIAGSQTDDENGNLTVTYQLSAAFAEDATIDFNAGNLANETTLSLCAACSYAHRVLFRFSDDFLAAGACGATVASARLVLYPSSWTGTGTIEGRSLKKAWAEASATWSFAATSLPWEVPGAMGSTDAGANIGSLAYQTSPARGVLDLTTTAGEWAAGTAANQGLLLTTGDTGATFWSTEAPDPANYPRLELQLVEPE